MNARKGFTLVELLIIIGIIGILFAVILIAVDPARRFADSRDAVRKQDVRDILEAIVEYTTDNKGNGPGTIDQWPASIQLIGTDTNGCNSLPCAGIATNEIHYACANLIPYLVEQYLAAIPMDPVTGSAPNTRYYVNQTNNGRFEVGSCDPERVTSISVKR